MMDGVLDRVCERAYRDVVYDARIEIVRRPVWPPGGLQQLSACVLKSAIFHTQHVWGCEVAVRRERAGGTSRVGPRVRMQPNLHVR